jgi:sRNA-binding regulator protein Hfq
MAKAKTKAPLQTLAEDGYLRKLAASKTPIFIKLLNGRIVTGKLEIFDADILRVAQSQGPSLLLYKDEVKYLWEELLSQ